MSFCSPIFVRRRFPAQCTTSSAFAFGNGGRNLRWIDIDGPSDEIDGPLIEASNSKGKEQKNPKCSDKF